MNLIILFTLTIFGFISIMLFGIYEGEKRVKQILGEDLMLKSHTKEDILQNQIDLLESELEDARRENNDLKKECERLEKRVATLDERISDAQSALRGPPRSLAEAFNLV